MAGRSLNRNPDPTCELVERVRGQSWRVDDARRDVVLGVGAPDWFSLSESPTVQRVKDGKARTVWRVLTDRGTFYAKTYVMESVAARLKQWFLGSPAEREWRVLKWAVERDVAVVQPVACGVLKGRPNRAVLVTEEFGEALRLPEMCRRIESTDRSDHRRETGKIIDAVASLFAEAHERGFVHRDNHPNNVLIRRLENGEYEARFVDVLGAELGSAEAAVHSFQAVGRFGHGMMRFSSRTQRMRFAVSYLARRSSWVRLEKSMIRQCVQQLSDEMALHKRALAKHRDRRIRGDGKYFARISVGDGWKATVVLQPERPERFPTNGFAGLSREAWRAELCGLLAEKKKSTRDEGTTFWNGLVVEREIADSFVRRLGWMISGSPHRRRFERCHQLRHRDVQNEFVAAYAEHRTLGQIDETLVVFTAQNGVR